MALRNIRTEGDEILRKQSKPVAEVNDKIRVLIEDMFDTMYEANGVGLAAPQVGILKQVVVIDDTNEHKMALINPVLKQIGKETQVSTEGCLSLPGYQGNVVRPKKVRVTALNPEGKKVSIVAEDMLAVILCHEIDHLSGILYKDKAENYHETQSQEDGQKSTDE